MDRTVWRMGSLKELTEGLINYFLNILIRSNKYICSRVNGVVNGITITQQVRYIILQYFLNIIKHLFVCLFQDLHCYVVTSDGRTYTAISRVIPELGWDLQVLSIYSRTCIHIFRSQDGISRYYQYIVGDLYTYIPELGWVLQPSRYYQYIVGPVYIYSEGRMGSPGTISIYSRTCIHIFRSQDGISRYCKHTVGPVYIYFEARMGPPGTVNIQQDLYTYIPELEWDLHSPGTVNVRLVLYTYIPKLRWDLQVL